MSAFIILFVGGVQEESRVADEGETIRPCYHLRGEYVRLRYDRIIPSTYRLAARLRISKIQALLFAAAKRARGSNATYINASSTQL